MLSYWSFVQNICLCWATTRALYKIFVYAELPKSCTMWLPMLHHQRVVQCLCLWQAEWCLISMSMLSCRSFEQYLFLCFIIQIWTWSSALLRPYFSLRLNPGLIIKTYHSKYNLKEKANLTCNIFSDSQHRYKNFIRNIDTVTILQPHSSDRQTWRLYLHAAGAQQVMLKGSCRTTQRRRREWSWRYTSGRYDW